MLSIDEIVEWIAACEITSASVFECVETANTFPWHEAAPTVSPI